MYVFLVLKFRPTVTFFKRWISMCWLFSFTGKSFAATINSSLTETRKVFEIPLKSNATPPGNKGPGAALTQWTEVQNHPGLVCAVAQTTSNPVVLLVKPTQIQVHELKPLPNKAKVQGMVAMRQHPSPGDPVSGFEISISIYTAYFVYFQSRSVFSFAKLWSRYQIWYMYMYL